MNSPVTKLLVVLAGVAAFFGGAYLIRQQLGIEITQESLRSYVDEMGPLAPVIFVAAVALRWVLAIPSAVILTVGGAVFGVTLGTLYGALGMTIMGLAQYILVHLAGADSLRARVPARFTGALEAARSWRGAATLAVVSAYPVGPQTPVQLAAALAGMGLVSFLASVGVGGLLRAGLFSWFGNSLLEGEGILLVSAAIAATVALPFLHPRSRAAVLSFLHTNEDPQR